METCDLLKRNNLLISQVLKIVNVPLVFNDTSPILVRNLGSITSLLCALTSLLCALLTVRSSKAHATELVDYIEFNSFDCLLLTET